MGQERHDPTKNYHFLILLYNRIRHLLQFISIIIINYYFSHYYSSSYYLQVTTGSILSILSIDKIDNIMNVHFDVLTYQ